MKSVRKITSESGKPTTRPTTEKPRRVFTKSPLARHVIYHDPHQWDEDIKTGDSSQ